VASDRGKLLADIEAVKDEIIIEVKRLKAEMDKAETKWDEDRLMTNAVPGHA